MINYSQYYTNNIYSQLLVEKIDIESPGLILDMGVGDGSLTKAAIRRWSEANYIAIDLDQRNCDAMQGFSSRLRIIREDGLKPNLNESLKIKVGSVDVAICNPPYQKIKAHKSQEIIFTRANLNSCINNKNITSDIVFLANNLSLLKENGYLGIILPDGLLTRADLQNLRADLLYNHTLKYIIQLPDKIFNKTEARTHIIILSKGKSQYSKVTLLLANSRGEYTDQIEIQKEYLVERMDFNFHKWKLLNKIKGITFGDIKVEITRGSFTHKELKEMDIEYFHTIHFNNNIFLNFNKRENNWKNKIFAESGDILMARVGKRCAGKLAIIEHGSSILSDCVYRIRVPELYRKIAWDLLNSNFGRDWIKVHSHGVCAQVISKKDLLNFPVFLNLTGA